MNVWIAYRHQLLKVSKEQLRMATVTERVADDVIHQELRAIGENSTADGQVLPKYLDISRDPLVDESTQASLEERAERRERFENRSLESGAQTNPFQPRNTENSMSPEELMLRRREVETERSTWPHRRISGKRAVDEGITSSVRKERIASSDLSLTRSPSESPLTPSDDAMVRLRDTRQSENRSDEQSKRVRVEEVAVIPWSGPSGEKRTLDVDDEEQQKKQCTGERSELRLSLPPPLPDDGDEILWCELVEHDNEVLAKWTAEIGELQEVTTEQLLQQATRKRKGNEKGSNVHEKSLIWAAKDTEWKKLEEKGAVRILTGANAEKAKAQFGDRFTPSRFGVTRPGQKSSRPCGVCEGIWILMSWSLPAVEPHNPQRDHSWVECSRAK